ncbi:hypothetical protein [Croceibacterium aestuarii]|uniref:hypothetical protein n=1 Tax=Croceibacterium aestuarii TaxID=3064139 RepID=UPI00272DD1FB|nr:hypothetical protein [Croceibacterium sp. D39]
MATQINGATSRPRLSPRYGAKADTGRSNPCQQRRSPTLSTLELRRLVAAMVD